MSDFKECEVLQMQGQVFILKLASSKVFVLLVCFVVYIYYFTCVKYIILKYLKEGRRAPRRREGSSKRRRKKDKTNNLGSVPPRG